MISSFFLVAFGQPAWVPLFGPLAALFGYALFWRAASKIDSRLQQFCLAAFWYAGVEAVQLSWMTATEYQGSYILFVYAGLALCLGILFGLFTLMIPKKGALSLVQILALASFWVLLEWARLYFLCGFSWNPAGLALTSYTLSLQMASLWGTLGLSFWVILTNGFALNVFRTGKRAWLPWLLIGAFPYFFGIGHLAYHDAQSKKEPGKSLSVSLVQTNLLPPEKLFFKTNADVYLSPFEQWRRIIRYLEANRSTKRDLIILPESALPFLASDPVYPYKWVENLLTTELGQEAVSCFPPLVPPFADEKKTFVSNLFWIQTLSNLYSAEIIAGLDHKEEKGDKNYQSAFYFVPGARLAAHDNKKILVPLAEYLPFEWLRKHTSQYGITAFYTPGKEFKVFKGKVPLAVSICYEETFSDLMRKGRAKGADLFVNITNDNWFPASRLPKQHFDHARLRTVENGVPLLRACNIGVTGAVDSLGRIISYQEQKGMAPGGVGEAIDLSLLVYTYPTLYTILGDMGVVLPSFIFLGFFCLQALPRRRRVKSLAQNA